MAPRMRILLLLATLSAVPAHADLYRWVDPQTGSVKFSSYPPPWFGDQARELQRAGDRGDRLPGARRTQAGGAGEAFGRGEHDLARWRASSPA